MHRFWRKPRTTHLAAAATLALLAACATSSELLPPTDGVHGRGWRVKIIPPAQQLTGGDPARGFDVITSGAYLGTGLPAEVLRPALAKDSVGFLRDAGLVTPHGFAFFEAANGVEVANGTCFTCHAGAVAGDTILGLGNSLGDYRGKLGFAARLLNFRMRLRYRDGSPEREQFADFGHYFRAMAAGTHTNQPRVNPAARIAETIMRYRDPQTLERRDEPAYAIAGYNIATDTPPLWNVAKKNALYYTAVGRGDFTKLIFQASVLGIPDSAQARQAQRAFVDVLAWLRALEPPAYPGRIDTALAASGRLLFAETCAGCHGDYGALFSDRADDTYPNKVVSVDAVRTDPLYAAYAVTSEITDWYNASWFATSPPRSRFEPEPGYVAPPLDGVWATAPYLHNGSVPTVWQLLDSRTRPTYWSRFSASAKTPSGAADEYDHARLGWRHRALERPRGKHAYDTTLPGYGKDGHTYGDHLTDAQRGAVVEYLKTL